MILPRLRWYAARLAAMSPAEVWHRLGEAVKKRGWRGDRRGWEAFSGTGDGAIGNLSFLRPRLAAAFGGTSVAEGLAAFDKGAFAGLGCAVSADDAEVWFRDPVRGGTWPSQAYCFDIDVRSTGAEGVGGRADVKFVWETNRLQFLHPLCARIAAQGEAADVAAALRILRHWADANPPYRGVNWFSGIELAMRMATLALLVAATPPGALSGDDRTLIRRLVAAHGFWLHRYPSKYSSANNHLIAEGLGLMLAGMLAPDLADAGAWEAEGRRILEREALAQIHADGVGAEQSPTYQAFVMEMLAFAELLAQEAGAPLAGVVTERLRAGATFLRALMDDAGGVPRIGDDDEGRVIACPPDREPRYVASCVAMVAGLAGDPSLAPPARDLHLRDALFAAPDAAASTPEGVFGFNAGGYTIIRRIVAGRRMVLTFDHGPLGHLSLAAHGHADALALWLSLDDSPVLVDAGTYLYHSGGALRAALRSSGAHNTVTVDGVSQSLPSSAFSWSRKARARRDDLDTGEDFHVSGRHDGYRRLGLTHRRRIDGTEGGFSVSDLLEGARTPHRGEICFLLAPTLTAAIDEEGVLVRDGNGAPLLRLTGPNDMPAALLRGERARGRGVHSAAFGALEPATQVVFAGPMGGFAKTTRVRIL